MASATPIAKATNWPDPAFQNSPQIGRHSVLCYGRSVTREFTVSGMNRSDDAAFRSANSDALFQKTPRFKLRDPAGRVIYDGPTLNALYLPEVIGAGPVRVDEGCWSRVGLRAAA